MQNGGYSFINGTSMGCFACGKALVSWQKKFCCRICANRGNARKNSISKRGSKNPMFGKKPANYKGGVSYTLSGSRKVKYRTITVKGVRLREHRFVMEKFLNRKLRNNEIVHHIDGDGFNNGIRNLQVMTKGEHSRLHADVSFLRGGDVYV